MSHSKMTNAAPRVYRQAVMTTTLSYTDSPLIMAFMHEAKKMAAAPIK
jgi:hypothetical protein